jgi:hypothetical protein
VNVFLVRKNSPKLFSVNFCLLFLWECDGKGSKNCDDTEDSETHNGCKITDEVIFCLCLLLRLLFSNSLCFEFRNTVVVNHFGLLSLRGSW